jgi:hypothetical protein
VRQPSSCQRSFRVLGVLETLQELLSARGRCAGQPSACQRSIVLLLPLPSWCACAAAGCNPIRPVCYACPPSMRVAPPLLMQAFVDKDDPQQKVQHREERSEFRRDRQNTWWCAPARARCPVHGCGRPVACMHADMLCAAAACCIGALPGLASV